MKLAILAIAFSILCPAAATSAIVGRGGEGKRKAAAAAAVTAAEVG